jgi:hypothetical protein
MPVPARLGGLDQGLDLAGRQVLPGPKLRRSVAWSEQLFDLHPLVRPA